MSNDEHAIRIRLDISIPNNGNPIQVDAETPPESSPRSRATVPAPIAQAAKPVIPPKVRSILGVILPAAGQPHSVRTDCGSGTAGVIYAQGNCTGIIPTPDQVVLQCNGGTAVNADLDSSGNWAHEAVPGATCSYDSSNQPYNQLLVMFNRDGDLLTSTTVPFYGQCACSGGGEETQRATANRFLPTNYVVAVDGFSQALAHFNGRWPLRVLPCRIDDAEIRWQYDLPGAAGSIELIGSPECGSAQLVFRDSVHEVRYKKPKASWHPMNVADFANCISVVVPPGASVPAIVQVELA